jgi:hypothetical protein
LGGVGLVRLADAMSLHKLEIYRIIIVQLLGQKEPKGSEVGIKGRFQVPSATGD